VHQPHLLNISCGHGSLQVKRAAYDASSNKWLLEGLIRQAIRSGEIAKAQPPYTPWNLGIYDALVLADKMTGCKGEPLPCAAGPAFCSSCHGMPLSDTMHVYMRGSSQCHNW
jgi:hypothetical protein